MKFAKKFAGSTGKCAQMSPDEVAKILESDKVLRAKMDNYASQYTANSMTAIASLSGMLAQREQSEGRKRKENHLHREFTATALVSKKFLKTKSGVAVDAAMEAMEREELIEDVPEVPESD